MPLMMHPKPKTHVAVYCQKCRKMIGYVVIGGHEDWVCAECSERGQDTAINLPDPPSFVWKINGSDEEAQ